ncbi:MAG: DNA circularization N-terminal domain-containing protein, partial [Treponema sp.]|nr:DNA circularization N-terminal domain-containing protein [Treponema sp.]
MSFTESLPSIYSKDWRKAERPTEDEAPRYSTYEAPGGKPLAFVQDDFDFSGGQSNETAEYPFDGLWSNTRLNKTPHKLTVNGHILGKTYIEDRENFLNALLVSTDDNNPGYLDLPFWGRFPVVVSEYSIGEKTNEKGQCSLRLVFIRAGITLEVRSESLVNTTIPTSLAAEKVQAAAIDDFANK